MILELDSRVQHILVLGAGASVDYGLPVWKGLLPLMKEKISKDIENRYQHKKEMLAWLNKIGEGREYATVDECIKKESVSAKYSDNGHEIENQIFLLIKDILQEAYSECDNGWVKILNEKILHDRAESMEHQIAFINYNYDSVLDDNFLDFSHLPKKESLLVHRKRIGILSRLIAKALYPHGNLFKEKEPEHIWRHMETMKSHDENLLDAVSCYESENHTIFNRNYDSSFDLYILGLGSGLEINLNKIKFSNNPIAKIHVTINDNSQKEKIINFLSKKYKKPIEEIEIYSTCGELVDKCF